MEKNNDLSPMWIEEGLRKERAKLQMLVNSYNSLKNKNTSYAMGIKRVMEIRKKVCEIWQQEVV